MHACSLIEEYSIGSMRGRRGEVEETRNRKTKVVSMQASSLSEYCIWSTVCEVEETRNRKTKVVSMHACSLIEEYSIWSMWDRRGEVEETRNRKTKVVSMQASSLSEEYNIWSIWCRRKEGSRDLSCLHACLFFIRGVQYMKYVR
jgi:hypothetical protein